MDDPAEEPEQASIFGDSQPETQQPQVVLASEHTSHPFFVGSRGRGRGGRNATRGATGRAEPATSGPSAPAVTNTSMIVPDEERPQFGPISMRELEFAQRRNADGAESSVWSDDDDDDVPMKKKHRRRRKAPSDQHARPQPTENDDEAAMAAAAFGGAVEEWDEDKEDDDECSEVQSSVHDDGSRLLPIRGEKCVGCICDRSIIETVDRFVRANATCMTETALYKAAALHYKNEVVLPRKREGVRVLPWQWKDLQAHYVLHTCDPLLQRAAAVRSLGAVRAVQEQNLMRHNSDGTKVLDHKGAELLLKIVALQDKQLLALDAARMPPPTSRGGR